MFRTASREETIALREQAARDGSHDVVATCEQALAGERSAARAVDELVALFDALARKLDREH